jgi:gas vesicle protein
MFDADGLIQMFATASQAQGDALRGAVRQATLQALRGRELTIQNIRQALEAVSTAASRGLAQNGSLGSGAPALLDTAVAGMDDALLKAVDANRAALQQLVDQGADLREKHLKKALDDLEQFEDAFIDSLKKAADGAGATLAGPWQQVLSRVQSQGSSAGSEAATAGRELLERMHDAVRDSRTAGLKAAQALAESYAALVSGVLIGMSDALQQQRQPGDGTPR